MGTQHNPKPVGHRESSPQREIHSTPGLLKNKEKLKLNNVISHLKELEKAQQKKPKVSRRKEIIKTRAEKNLKNDRKDQ